jgi:hypothetical protein
VNLTSVLKTNQNLTLFAPTDAAFAALPAGELDKLMLPENGPMLQKVLTYHLINAKVDSTKIKGAKGEVKSVEGDQTTTPRHHRPSSPRTWPPTRPPRRPSNSSGRACRRHPRRRRQNGPVAHQGSRPPPDVERRQAHHAQGQLSPSSGPDIA